MRWNNNDPLNDPCFAAGVVIAMIIAVMCLVVAAGRSPATPVQAEVVVVPKLPVDVASVSNLLRANGYGDFYVSHEGNKPFIILSLVYLDTILRDIKEIKEKLNAKHP